MTPGRRRSPRSSITLDVLITLLVVGCAVAAVFFGAGYLVGRLLF